MKKSMLLGMVLLTVVFGVVGCGTTETEVHYSDEELVEAYLEQEYEFKNLNISKVEIADYDSVSDMISYLAYEGEDLKYGGCVDRSYAWDIVVE